MLSRYENGFAFAAPTHANKADSANLSHGCVLIFLLLFGRRPLVIRSLLRHLAGIVGSLLLSHLNWVFAQFHHIDNEDWGGNQKKNYHKAPA